MADLKIKTVGTENPTVGGKNYTLSAEGHEVVAVTNGKGKFICPRVGVERWSSIKEIKMAFAIYVENGGSNGSTADPEDDEAAEMTSAADHPGGGTTFDCIDPCALLIDRLRNVFGVMSPEGQIFDTDVHRTLDVKGWLDPNGNADRGRAEAEIGRYRMMS